MPQKSTCPVIYGPIPSRRLGFSLGIDILPFKTCSLDCQYCQLGPTPSPVCKRKGYGSTASLTSQIKHAIDRGKKIDFITFSGSGEPTLNKKIGQMIKATKKHFSIPVAVLTNSTLLTRKSVRRALHRADLVVPSLDAASQDVFIQLNRPHPDFHIQDILQGLKTFRRNFRGKLWLEVMLVKGINDSREHLQKLKSAIQEIKPDLVQLNTVVRPPAISSASPLNRKELEDIQDYLGGKCEIIADFKRKGQTQHSRSIENDITAVASRRPVTLEDLTTSLGMHRNELIKHLESLKKAEKIKIVSHKDKIFYETSSSKGNKNKK
jgi:wyosine [tRNA(Phe)-imidazoG37] synthetase (radical SAM superfamily)